MPPPASSSVSSSGVAGTVKPNRALNFRRKSRNLMRRRRLRRILLSLERRLVTWWEKEFGLLLF
jgi:hypothetical protein